MNPIISPSSYGSSVLVRQLVKEKENSEFKPVKLCLKIDLVSYPAQAEGLVNMIKQGFFVLKRVRMQKFKVIHYWVQKPAFDRNINTSVTGQVTL